MSTLADIFSGGTDSKFARLTRPEEFASKKRAPVEEEKRVKKPKHKKREKESSSEAEGSVALVDDATAAVSGGAIVPASVTANVSSIELINGSDSSSSSNSKRTIFVGNLPLSATIKSITKLFRPFGEVESVRLRSVPVAGTKVGL